MFQSRLMTGFVFDEWVIYVATPSLDARSYWLGMAIRTLIGLLLFVLPGIIVLSIGLSSALTARTTLRERYGGAECVVTSKRIIAGHQGLPNRGPSDTIKVLPIAPQWCHSARGRRQNPKDLLADTRRFMNETRLKFSGLPTNA